MKLEMPSSSLMHNLCLCDTVIDASKFQFLFLNHLKGIYQFPRHDSMNFFVTKCINYKRYATIRQIIAVTINFVYNQVQSSNFVMLMIKLPWVNI